LLTQGDVFTMQDSSTAERFFANKVEFTTGPAELKHMLDNGSVNVLDVRAQADYEKAHIPGARSLPKDRWAAFEGLERDKMNVIYCYSQTCHLAANAARKFAAEKYPVMELDGGFKDWTEHHYRTESGTFKRGA
jgi:rhodanese-related sulfurtransferase